MRDRVITLGLITFGPPALYLLAEAVAWFIDGPRIIELLIDVLPDLLKLILVLWVAGIAYGSGRIVWHATSAVRSGAARMTLRSLGVVLLTFGLLFAGFAMIAAWSPVVTVRYHG